MMRLRIAFLLSAVTAANLPAQTFNTLHKFVPSQGELPWAGVIQGADGSFYGTAEYGGVHGLGTVFKIARDGAFTTLYDFCSQLSGEVCIDGEVPAGGLFQARDGYFYGTTYYGGAVAGPYGGYGTVFKISPAGALTTIYSFCSKSGCADGEAPMGTLLEASDGAIYGVTFKGGAGGAGTVFRITAKGALTTVHNFCSAAACADGEGPQGSLIQAGDGAIYGTTASGGIYAGGTVFRIAAGGELKTLASFCYGASYGCTGGGMLFSGVVQGPNGNFYGTTYYNTLGGTIYEVTPGGTVTTLYTFCPLANCSDGQYPQALILGSDGNFYGTTLEGGAFNAGTAFQITPGGALTTLHSFCAQGNCADGNGPLGGLMQATDGSFYGTTEKGGNDYGCRPGCGTIFRLSGPGEITNEPN
jgi:uncharacterized repeat protein (TIGR03803 family)